MVATPVYHRRGPDPASAPPRRGAGRIRLSCEEEYALAAHAAAGDRGARDRLVQANLGLVVTIARRFLGRGLDLDDLIGEGNLGLIRAAQRFDPGFGTRFSTYACCWISQAIREALIHTASAIRVPEQMVGLLKKWRRAEWVLGRDLGREPSFDEVASYLGLREERRTHVARALEAGRLRPGGRSDDGAVAGLLAEVADGRPVDERLDAEEERAVAWRLIERLKSRERAVLMLRFGLEGEPLTLEQIGRRLGVTRERVRQLEAQALRTLARCQTERTPEPRHIRSHRESLASSGPVRA
jgi:RNA polymerase primary sigma factor